MNIAPLLPAFIIAIAAVALPAVAADPNAEILARFEARTYADASGKTLLYRLAKPADFDKNKSYPLVLSLHGAGGRGADNLGQIRDASPNTATKFALPKYQEKFPCFIVAPQCSGDRKWVDVDWAAASHTMPAKPTDELRMVVEVLEQLRKEFPVDGRRIYVTGLSMGGYGTWDVIARHPNYFAAAAPVCGGGDEAAAGRIASIPLWCFHGGKDGVVKPQRSRNMIEAIKKAGGEPKYTEYPNAGHDSWVPAYNEAEFLPWLFAQKLKAEPKLASTHPVAADPNVVVLWPDGAPGALGNEAKDIPTLTPYLAPEDKATGAAVVICPGGGYGGLAGHEGHDYALYLNQQGVSAFVLKYRLGSGGYRHPCMLQDAARAVRTVRAKATEWKVDPRHVGIMGSSAGGHLASTLVTHFDAGKPDADDPIERQSSRPDIGILCYAVISMETGLTHGGSRNNLLGKEPAEDLVKLLSNEQQVTKDTPPCFIWHTWEDKAVKVENSLQFAAAMQKAGVPFDLHIYQKGGHGIGLADKPPFNNPHPWAKDLVVWLKVQGFVK